MRTRHLLVAAVAAGLFVVLVAPGKNRCERPTKTGAGCPGESRSDRTGAPVGGSRDIATATLALQADATPPYPGKKGYQGPRVNVLHGKGIAVAARSPQVPSTGTNTAIAIRVQFINGGTDYTGAPSGAMDLVAHDAAYFQAIVDEMRDYYLEASGNVLTVNTTISANVYTLANNMAYYGDNPNSLQRRYELIRDAVLAADNDIDFSLFDSVIVFHAGAGEETDIGPPPPPSQPRTPDSWNDIWSSRLTWTGSFIFTTNDGTDISEGIILPEYEDQDGLSGISCLGVACHEYGHALDLIDFYDRDGGSEGIGNWGLMAGGNWNGSGASPAHPCAWAKVDLGWITPIDITANSPGFSLQAVATSGQIARVWAIHPSVSTTEFFLLENRQRQGYDSALPGDGLLIWHVDETIADNDDEAHRQVDLEEADELTQSGNGLDGVSGSVPDPGDRGSPNDPFYLSNETAFTPVTTPNTRSYDGIRRNTWTNNISASGATMTMDIRITPLVTITSPEDESRFNTPNILVTGTVDDPNIATVDVYLNFALAATFGVSAGSFSDTITLVEGTNLIEVRATDAAGWTGTSGEITVILDTTVEGTAIDRGLAWLAGNQIGGYWEYSPVATAERFAMPARVGTTGLAALAFINRGYSPVKSDSTLKRAIDYIFSQVNLDGSIYDDIPVYPPASEWAMSFPVYETSMGLCALVGAWEVTPAAERDPLWDDAILDAADWLMRSDVHLASGGWGYTIDGAWYEPFWVDLSNTQFATLALKAVHASAISDAALEATIDQHLSNATNTETFIRSCQNPDGGFYYRPGGDEWTPGTSYGSMTAAGLWSLWTCGITLPDPDVASAQAWFDTNIAYNVNPGMPAGAQEQQWLYYYFLTAAKAFTMQNWSTVGGSDWYVDLTQQLSTTQNADGSWGPIADAFPYVDTAGEPKTVATAQAVLALETQASVLGGEMQIILSTQADLHLYDADGNHVGYNYATGQVDLEIPKSWYSGYGTPSQVIRIFDPNGGGYVIRVVGNVYEAYDLTVNGISRGIVVSSETVTSVIRSDQVAEYDCILASIVGPANVVLEPEEDVPYSPYAAFVSGGDVKISGNARIKGEQGNVTGNLDALVEGNPTVVGEMSIVGEAIILGHPQIGSTVEGAPPVAVPVVDPAALATKRATDIDYVLTDDGKACDGEGNVLLDCYATGQTFNGWAFVGDPSSPPEENIWELAGDSTVNGTYYINTQAKVSGSPGKKGQGITATYIVTHSIGISGTPKIRWPDLPGFFILAGGDVRISGNVTLGSHGDGQGFVMAHEQVCISGNADIHGSVIAEDAEDVDPLVTGSDYNLVGGHPTITYEGGLETWDLEVTAVPQAVILAAAAERRQLAGAKGPSAVGCSPSGNDVFPVAAASLLLVGWLALRVRCGARRRKARAIKSS